MKRFTGLAVPLLMLAGACTGTTATSPSVAGQDGIAMGRCERLSSCRHRDAAPRYGPRQQRVVEDEMRGRQEPM